MFGYENGYVNQMNEPSYSWESDISDDVLIDVIDVNGKILFINGEQGSTLGLDTQAAQGLDIASIYDPQSVIAIESLFKRDLPRGFQTTLELSMIGRGSRIVKTIARCRSAIFNDKAVFRFVKLPLGSLADEFDDVRADNLVLKQIVDNASEGHWCIEFVEPVDLSNSKPDIIDQIFENASIWRVTNKSMARLYDLPTGESIRTEDVRLYWPRSKENEDFVEQMLEAKFHIDGAIAIDLRHDGSSIHVENDVRADIEDGLLLRIWGNCRDVTDTNGGNNGS
jgi:hypothetical protein